jgi:hypothetical protein
LYGVQRLIGCDAAVCDRRGWASYPMRRRPDVSKPARAGNAGPRGSAHGTARDKGHVASRGSIGANARGSVRALPPTLTTGAASTLTAASACTERGFLDVQPSIGHLLAGQLDRTLDARSRTDAAPPQTLGAAQRAQLDDDGYVVVPGILSERECDLWSQVVDKIWEEQRDAPRKYTEEAGVQFVQNLQQHSLALPAMHDGAR